MYVNIGAFLLVIRMNKAFLPAGMWVCINVTDQRNALSQVQFFFFCWTVHVNDRVIISPFFFFLIYFLHRLGPQSLLCVSPHLNRE